MNQAPRAKSSTREEKAQVLIAAGAVRLLVGTGSATVKGSGHCEYVVTRESCTCPDFAKRGVDCKHRLATRELCRLYRECSREARETGKTRLPANLARALRGTGRLAAQPAPVTAQPVIDQDDLFPAQTLDRLVA